MSRRRLQREPEPATMPVLQRPGAKKTGRKPKGTSLERVQQVMATEQAKTSKAWVRTQWLIQIGRLVERGMTMEHVRLQLDMDLPADHPFRGLSRRAIAYAFDKWRSEMIGDDDARQIVMFKAQAGMNRIMDKIDWMERRGAGEFIIEDYTRLWAEWRSLLQIYGQAGGAFQQKIQMAGRSITKSDTGEMTETVSYLEGVVTGGGMTPAVAMHVVGMLPEAVKNGMDTVVDELLALNAAEAEAVPAGLYESSGVALRPHADVTMGAERDLDNEPVDAEIVEAEAPQPKTAFEALNLL